MKTQTPKLLGLKTILVASLTIWAVVCVVLHGSAIVAYIALQAATSGVFAFAFWRAEKAACKSRKVSVRTSPATTSHAPQREVEHSLVGAA
ncbi:MAG: hypothetical protein O3A00_02925 [Planctomycetota bacterium]|nr:hypothetical protein [Planctomycetota bacterium]